MAEQHEPDGAAEASSGAAASPSPADEARLVARIEDARIDLAVPGTERAYLVPIK